MESGGQIRIQEGQYGFSRASTETFMDFRKANTKPSLHFRRAHTKIYQKYNVNLSKRVGKGGIFLGKVWQPCQPSENPVIPSSLLRSRSKQAPGSEFHPCDKSDKIDCGFLGPSLFNKKVNAKTYIPWSLYELLVSNIAHQMKEKLIKKRFPYLREVSLKFEFFSFFSRLKQPEKIIF